MTKLKFYAANAFFSGLIGTAVYILALCRWGWRYFRFNDMVFSTVIGMVIGSISLFFLFHIFLKLKTWPVIGFLSNFLVVAVLNVSGGIIFIHVRSCQEFFRTLWFFALIVSEVLSFFLTYAWYRRIRTYKAKLEQKKIFLREREESSRAI